MHLHAVHFTETMGGLYHDLKTCKKCISLSKPSKTTTNNKYIFSLGQVDFTDILNQEEVSLASCLYGEKLK